MALEYAAVDAVKSRIELTGDQQLDWTDEETDFLQRSCDQINPWIERKIDVAAGPIDDTTLTLDGLSSRKGGRMMFVRIGIRELTQLEVAPYTGADFVIIPSSDCFLRPLPTESAHPDIPPQQLWLSDFVNGSYSRFPSGFANVRLTGAFGPAEMLADVVEIAEIAVAKAWFARRAGQEDMTGSDGNGRPMVSRWVAGRDLNTLDKIRNAFRRFAV